MFNKLDQAFRRQFEFMLDTLSNMIHIRLKNPPYLIISMKFCNDKLLFNFQ